MTLDKLISSLYKKGARGSDEIRISPDPDLTDQTEQDIEFVQKLLDEDGNEFYSINVENT